MPRINKADIATEDKTIKIPPIKLKQARITLQGSTPLLVNRFDEKSRREIEEKSQKKAKQKKEFGTPEEQFKSTLYTMPGKKDRYGIPASGVKNCAVSACRFVDGIPMTIAKGSFHIVGDEGGLLEIKGSKPEIDARIVRVGTFGNKKPCTRYRARFDKWETTFDILYNSSTISPEQLLNLYENAGFAVGLCEYRPEKGGNLGMFSVKRS
jgi:hypothetical protein